MGHDRMIACGDNGCWCYSHQEMLSALEQRISGMTDSRKIIEASLKIAVEYYQADRAFVLDIDDELDVGCNTYEYCSNGVDSKRRQLRTVPLELLPKWHEAVSYTHLSCAARLPVVQRAGWSNLPDFRP